MYCRKIVVPAAGAEPRSKRAPAEQPRPVPPQRALVEPGAERGQDDAAARKRQLMPRPSALEDLNEMLSHCPLTLATAGMSLTHPHLQSLRSFTDSFHLLYTIALAQKTNLEFIILYIYRYGPTETIIAGGIRDVVL